MANAPRQLLKLCDSQPPSSSVGTTGDLIKSLRLGSLRQRSTAQGKPTRALVFGGARLAPPSLSF
tara:strand:- start:164 stop:358 length:195 start_codon:yes stop_codon:yes gene_type:complete